MQVHVDLYVTSALEDRESSSLDDLYASLASEWIDITLVPLTDSFSFPGHYIWESYLKSGQIWEALKNNLGVDFIYAQGFSGWKTLQVKQSRPELPLVGVNFHGLEMWQKPASLRVRMEQWMLRPFVRQNIRLSDADVLLGQKLTPIIEAAVGCDRTIIESSNGVTDEWLMPAQRTNSNPVRFVFVGRYERRKGIEELHRTIRRFSTAFDFRFDMVGPIPESLHLNSDKMHYWGMVRSEETMRQILHEADVLICPSYAEGMPTVILEAMACRLAIIASDVGAVGDLVTEENGWLIPPGDQAALEKAMQKAIQGGKEQLERKKTAGYQRVQNAYLWPHVAARTIQDIASLLKTQTQNPVSA